MKQNQDRSKAISLLYEAVAYSMGGIFLLTIARESVWIGWLFMAFSAFLIIASFRTNLIRWADRGRVLWAYPLFAATVAHFIITAVGSKQSIYIILASIFLALLCAGIVFQNVKIFKKH